MNIKLIRNVIAIVMVGFLSACASQPERDAGYDAFLQTLAKDCRPLVIGSDNFGQAIVFNGQGAQSDHYSMFLSTTRSLYSGGITGKEFYDAYANSGVGSKAALDCVVAHAPKK
jgi:hypothetical protein